jgi:DNA-binding MarR family transcriptional regulator
VTEFVLDDFLPYQLAVLANRVSDRFSQSYYDKFGISVAEWRVVAHLSQAEKVSIREIYRQVEMDKSKASRAAARLEKAGYVSKRVNEADRRLIELELTPKGRAMVAEIGPLGQSFEAEILACLPQQDRAAFLASIRTLLEKCS